MCLSGVVAGEVHDLLCIFSGVVRAELHGLFSVFEELLHQNCMTHFVFFAWSLQQNRMACFVFFRSYYSRITRPILCFFKSLQQNHMACFEFFRSCYCRIAWPVLCFSGVITAELYDLYYIFQESLRQNRMTRFYLQQKEDPHGPSISLFVGNLPTGLSQRQYEKILLDIIGKGESGSVYVCVCVLYVYVCFMYRQTL